MDITISNIPEISAIYYALLQCGYDYFGIDRTHEHIAEIRSFVGQTSVPAFFSEVKQSTCDVYHYWPRAAILETAAFYLLPDHTQFQDYRAFQSCIMSAGNIAEHERDQKLWKWLSEFPTALTTVLDSSAFQGYLAWETKWLNKQNILYEADLQLIRSITEVCLSKYNSPVREIQIVVNPIKCVYSADYHLNGKRFVYCSGILRADSVVHEYLHHVIHPVIMEKAETLLMQDRLYTDIDASYYLTGDRAGRLNAFEEYAVRSLTRDIMTGHGPDNLSVYLSTIAER